MMMLYLHLLICVVPLALVQGYSTTPSNMKELKNVPGTAGSVGPVQVPSYYWYNMQRFPDSNAETVKDGGLFGLQPILEGDRAVDMEAFVFEDH